MDDKRSQNGNFTNNFENMWPRRKLQPYFVAAVKGQKLLCKTIQYSFQNKWRHGYQKPFRKP